MPAALCHPDRVHLARGLCGACYHRDRRSRVAPTEKQVADGRIRARRRYEAKTEDCRDSMRRNRALHPERVALDTARINAYRRSNVEKVRLLARGYAHNRRARRGGGGLTPQEWQAILAAFGGCAYPGPHEGPIEQDHVEPLALGGRHEAANVVPACRRCNRRKGRQRWTPRQPLHAASF